MFNQLSRYNLKLMEKAEPEEVKQKHSKIDEGQDATHTTEVEIIKNDIVKNTVSSFISRSKNWTDEEQRVPEDIVINLVDNL